MFTFITFLFLIIPNYKQRAHTTFWCYPLSPPKISKPERNIFTILNDKTKPFHLLHLKKTLSNLYANSLSNLRQSATKLLNTFPLLPHINIESDRKKDTSNMSSYNIERGVEGEVTKKCSTTFVADCSMYMHASINNYC